MHSLPMNEIDTTKSLNSLQSDAANRRLLRLLKRDRLLAEEYDAASQSLYRWWWECLRESEDYAAALRGDRGEPFSGLVQDFGDLDEAFPLWWLRKGRMLFAEQVHGATVAELEELRTAKDGNWLLATRDAARPSLYLRIPLTEDRRDIMRQVAELVDQAQTKRHHEIEVATQPRRTFYPDQRIRLDTIKTLLAVWRARKDTEEQWWQTGERLGYWPQFACLPADDEATIKHKRRIMTLTVQRFQKTAAKLIDYSARGDFPRVK